MRVIHYTRYESTVMHRMNCSSTLMRKNDKTVMAYSPEMAIYLPSKTPDTACCDTCELKKEQLSRCSFWLDVPVCHVVPRFFCHHHSVCCTVQALPLRTSCCSVLHLPACLCALLAVKCELVCFEPIRSRVVLFSHKFSTSLANQLP